MFAFKKTAGNMRDALQKRLDKKGGKFGSTRPQGPSQDHQEPTDIRKMGFGGLMKSVLARKQYRQLGRGKEGAPGPEPTRSMENPKE